MLIVVLCVLEGSELVEVREKVEMVRKVKQLSVPAFLGRQ